MDLCAVKTKNDLLFKHTHVFSTVLPKWEGKHKPVSLKALKRGPKSSEGTACDVTHAAQPGADFRRLCDASHRSDAMRRALATPRKLLWREGAGGVPLTWLGALFGEQTTQELDASVAQTAVAQVQGGDARMHGQRFHQQRQPVISQRGPVEASQPK